MCAKDKKWYVFDKYDCFDGFASATDAAVYAESKVRSGTLEDGVHIAYMTRAQHAEYCTNNDLKQAWRAR